MLKLIRLAFCLSIFLLEESVALKDGTLEENASGSVIVDATLNILRSKCIFPSDKLFMRRLAYVESHDGLDKDTFRPKYDGGIWQVDENAFRETKTIKAFAKLAKELLSIRRHFNIRWSTVRWRDLRKPLYSALAARLYLLMRTDAGESIPISIKKQADFWKKHYRPKGDTSDFIKNARELLKAELKNCGRADIIFLIDGSGSVLPDNFRKIKRFVRGVVGGLHIGEDKTRVGLMQFATRVTTHFHLNTYSTKKEILDAIDKVDYKRGSTNTHLGIYAMTYDEFTSAHGARDKASGHARVGIVLTDGESNYPVLTTDAAERAHYESIQMFAIGVGSTINRAEIRSIASPPACLNKFILSDFSEVEDLQDAIKRHTCKAPVIIRPSENGTDIGGKLEPGEGINCKIQVPKQGATVKVNTQGGSATFYVASNAYPSEAYYDYKVSAQPDQNGVVFIPAAYSANGTEFCNIKGDNNTSSNITVGVKPGDKDWCKSQPCQNGGTCKDRGEKYKCKCPISHTGKHCETLIDNCKSAPCQHGSCVNQPGSFRCRCEAGYTGDLCQIEIDHCKSSPCTNGDCSSQAGGYECKCREGFTGKQCESKIDHCQSSPCQNGDCSSQPGGYLCKCKEGFTGKQCESEIDHCKSSPCQNGDCSSQPGGYTCKCKEGFTGKQCESEIDHCKSSPCQNGDCSSQPGGYTCKCKEGFTGKQCESEIDHCKSSPCQNGDCSSHPGGYVCKCRQGFTGKQCESEIDHCMSSPCQNGDCSSQPGDYVCKCKEGFTGKQCESEIDHCKSSPCQNGDCNSQPGGYVCKCKEGFTGKQCESEIDHCKSSPCQNGDCASQPGGYTCKCREGFTGKQCESEIDHCKSSPCHNGDCSSQPNSFVCKCKDGFTGKQCESEIDHCKSSPCQNGDCSSQPGGYTCKCKDGFTGKQCESEIDHCKSSPCQNGDCSSQAGGYSCQCKEGFTGKQCESEIDNCKSSPCQNGDCDSQPGGYTCKCREGFTGKQCESEINSCNGTSGSNCVSSCRARPDGDYQDCRRCRCFITCAGGRRFSMRCPARLVWDDSKKRCGYTSPTCSMPSNCEDSDDACSKIQCIHGTCAVTSGGPKCTCKPGFEGKACDQAPNGFDCTDMNPCHPITIAQGRLFFPHRIRTKYVQCALNRRCYLKKCPPGLVFDRRVNTCNWPMFHGHRKH